MSNLWLNICFGRWHLQAGDPHIWSFRVRKNKYVENPPAFRIYRFRPFTD